MTNEQHDAMMRVIRDKADTLQEEGYHTAMHAPTTAARDIRFLLSVIDSNESELNWKKLSIERGEEAVRILCAAALLVRNWRNEALAYGRVLVPAERIAARLNQCAKELDDALRMA